MPNPAVKRAARINPCAAPYFYVDAVEKLNYKKTELK